MTFELDLPEWMDDGACRGSDPDVFFPPKGHAGAAGEARQICATCKVIDECRDYALEHGLKYGVWGGTSVRERRRIRNAM